MRVNVVHNNRSQVQLACPRDRDSIRRDAYLLRAKLGLKNQLYFPIVGFLENTLPVVDPSFCLEVVEDEELPGRQAEYIPMDNAIRVKCSVYEAAVDGHWWARSTLAHELGHYYYHDEQSVRYAKRDVLTAVPVDEDPERQANIFAAELLAPINLIEGMDERTIGTRCLVPYEVAKRQLQTLNRVRRRQAKKKKQKKKRPSLVT